MHAPMSRLLLVLGVARVVGRRRVEAKEEREEEKCEGFVRRRVRGEGEG